MDTGATGNKWILAAILLLFVVVLLALMVPFGVLGQSPEGAVAGDVLRVDASATGAGDGTSWADAFTSLQDALDVVGPGDEIWVAAGTYVPSQQHGGAGERYKSFQLTNEVALYGGFDGTETTREEREWQANVTILSADIGLQGDDSDNCYHVFYHPAGLALDASAILDGFTISGGNADGSGDHDSGGGMFNDYSSPTVANCTFADNSAGYGGGMHNGASSPLVIECAFTGNSAIDGGGIHNSGNVTGIVTGCTFFDNTAVDAGGGMANKLSDLEVADSAFVGNQADGNGGGMYNYASPMTVTASLFLDNWAGQNGGGMKNHGSGATVVACTFGGNSAIRGGGMENDGSNALVRDCNFRGNTAAWIGGAVSIWGCSPVIVNSVFWYNQADAGGAVCTYESGSPIVISSSFFRNSASNVGGAMCSRKPIVTNSILWEDTPEEIAYDELGTGQVTYSNVQGGYTGEGNIDADPLFSDPEHGDFHLVGASPCIDAGLDTAPYLPATDYEGDDRILDGDLDGTPTVDMGIDEAQEPVAISGLQVYSDSPTDLGSATTLTGTVTAGNNVRYEWVFGDGEAGVGTVVTHAYAAEGVYSVQIIASNMLGELSAATTVTVTAPLSWVVYLPVVVQNLGPP
jgi:hypothetical protein